LRNQLADWFNDRTGLRDSVRSLAEETLSGGARWRYVFGSALASVFLIQAFTGVLMMTAYSPSSSDAWGSVYYISHVMWMGWFIRGLHHFGAQTVMVLLALHVIQTLVAGAYRRPREINWWLGLVLLVLTVGFAHTGYQLPWDQKGYWATKVVTGIMSGAPFVGPAVRTAVVGGSEFGNQTLTRFYGLHVGILPALMFLCLWAHLKMRRRHGLTTPPGAAVGEPPETYWPDQAFRNNVFLAVVVGIMVALVLVEGGAPLDAPANPSSADYPARPEWFFLFLFQFLKHLPGRLEWVGSILIPGAILLILFLLPLLDRLLPSRLIHFAACVFLFTIVGGAGYLTAEALLADAKDTQFQRAREAATQETRRALFLASSPEAGIPPEGAGFLMRRDPLTHGLGVMERKCLGCHVVGGQGNGEQTAADLKDFGSRDWIRGLLEDPAATTYFGKTPRLKGMLEWKKSSKLKPEQLDQIADFVASFARIPADTPIQEWVDGLDEDKEPVVKLFRENCGTCHVIDGYTDGGLRDAPSLFAWGSPQWITRMIRRPSAPEKYGYLEADDRMPGFGTDQLTSNDIEMVVRFLRGDYPRP
jgi:ubiquinol-cytochrome c reductase cytochrome b subunit